MVTVLLSLTYPGLKYNFAAIRSLLGPDRMRTEVGLLCIMMITGALNWLLFGPVTARVVLRRKHLGKPSFLVSIERRVTTISDD